MHEFAALLAATLAAGTPLALAALGLLVSEKSGAVNLGAEGLMLMGAITGFAVAAAAGPWLGFAAAAAVGAVLAALLGWMMLWLGTNPYASGLALALFGGGLSAFIGIGQVGHSLPQTPSHAGAGLFAGLHPLAVLHPLVWASIALALAIHLFLERTRAGLVLRAVGESPEAARALGLPVRRVRMAALMFGGALCALAGAYLSEVYTPMWVQGMTAGRGWIALALTTFASWRAARVLLGAYLFGGVTLLQFYLQGAGVPVAPQLLAMLPYLATVIVLAALSGNARWLRTQMPASLGRRFEP